MEHPTIFVTKNDVFILVNLHVNAFDDPETEEL